MMMIVNAVNYNCLFKLKQNFRLWFRGNRKYAKALLKRKYSLTLLSWLHFNIAVKFLPFVYVSLKYLSNQCKCILRESLWDLFQCSSLLPVKKAEAEVFFPGQNSGFLLAVRRNTWCLKWISFRSSSLIYVHWFKYLA